MKTLDPMDPMGDGFVGHGVVRVASAVTGDVLLAAWPRCLGGIHGFPIAYNYKVVPPR